MISIIMANYNNAQYISDSIESVLSQSFLNWNLIIIDDCSLDNSLEVVEKYLSNSKIKLIKNKKNVGYTKNLIKGVQEVDDEIIVILDSDDALASDALEKIYKYYEKNLKCDYVYSQCYYCDSGLSPVHRGFSGETMKGNSVIRLNNAHHIKTFRKSTYLKTSGYDEKIKYAEDIDLTLKMEEVGNLCFLDEPLYYYRVLPRSQSHGFLNTQINRSSTALAKLNAYKRRLGTDIPNLDKNEVAEVLFWGMITSILAKRFRLNWFFIKESLRINPFFLFKSSFYKIVFKKINKMLKLKREKPLLKI